MVLHIKRTEPVLVSALLGACLACAVAACSSSTNNATGSGSVKVLYAGSLSNLMTKSVGPAFKTATGYAFNGTAGDSGTLANEIKGKTMVGDVFISASPSKDQALEGSANGDWVTWYATFGTSPLVVGYNPSSKYATAFRTEPWYTALARPGLLVGRTDPATDPKGALTKTALTTGASTFGEPRLATELSDSSEVFPEATLVGRLQSGQLDAGFFYSVEATAAGITFVPVTGVGTLQAQYTITVLNNAPDPAGAAAFVEYLLGANGQRQLTKAGIFLKSPVAISGKAPSDLQGILSGR